MQLLLDLDMALLNHLLCNLLRTLNYYFHFLLLLKWHITGAENCSLALAVSQKLCPGTKEISQTNYLQIKQMYSISE